MLTFVTNEGEMKLPIVLPRYVMPGRRYLKLLHGNVLGMPRRDQDRFLRRLRRDAERITDAELEILLTSEWRARLTASWLIAASRRATYVDRLGRLLISSELTFAGQGYCVALARIGTESAQDHLVRYLDHWLPQTECRYDQAWAMSALVIVDRKLGSELSARFLQPGGLWDAWAREEWPTDQQVRFLSDLLALIDEPLPQQ
jgi:hypothetical protein